MTAGGLIKRTEFGIISDNKTKEGKMIFGFLQNIGPWQLVICIVVAFVLFGGAKKIPDLAKALGKAKSECKKGIAEGEKDEEELKKEEPQKELV